MFEIKGFLTEQRSDAFICPFMVLHEVSECDVGGGGGGGVVRMSG